MRLQPGKKNIFTIFDLGSKLHDLVNKRGLTDIETMFEKCSKFRNSLSEPTELNVCQNYLPTVLRNRHVGRGLLSSFHPHTMILIK